jgi:hypothetical protein
MASHRHIPPVDTGQKTPRPATNPSKRSCLKAELFISLDTYQYKFVMSRPGFITKLLWVRSPGGHCDSN